MKVYSELARKDCVIIADRGNWWTVYDEERNTFYSVAKPDSGAHDSWYGDMFHVKKLLRTGLMKIEELTEEGKEILGYE